MSEFTNLTLLECSRNQSNQYESNDNSNNSIWTNRMGKTISLDVGDTIEVKSAYINQRGCANPDSIEFKGEDLDAEIELEETTEVVPDVYTYEQTIYPWNDLSVKPALNNFQQGNLGFRFRNNKIVKKRLKDNVLYLEQNYYKNANGEETIMLPRSFNRKRQSEVPTTNHEPTPANPFPNIHQSVSRYWTYSDVDYDYNQHTNIVNLGVNTGHPTLKVQNTRYTDPHGDPLNRNLIPIFNTHDWECKFVQGDAYPTTKIEAEPVPPAVYTRSNFWMMKQRNDNSRFTLFEREFDFTIWSLYGGDTADKDNDTYNPKFDIKNSDGDVVYHLSSYRWFKNDPSIGAYDPQGANANFPPGYRRIEGTQPAICRYVKVSDVIEINIKTGFNSPEDVANQITQTLQQQKKNSPITYQKPEAVGNSNGEVFQDAFSVGIETPTYKPVITTTYKDFNTERIYGEDPIKTSNFIAYMEDGTQPEKYNGQGAFEWWRTHHNIYVKRPDLFVAGRKVNTRYCRIWNPSIATAPPTPPDADLDLLQHGIPNKILNDINYDEHEINNTTDKIITSWIWNKTNLDRLKNLMDVQGQYPELFSGIDDTIQNNQYLTNIERFVDEQGPQVRYKPFATINNSRFLHINRFDEHNPAEATGWGDNFITLGDDDYRRFNYTKTIDGQQRDFGATHMSMPVFFYFDKERRNKLTSGEDENDLCYGCFSKSQASIDGSAPVDVITIHPEKLNGIRKEAFELRGGNTNGTNEWHPANITAGTCYIGWDWHFNSYGNLVLLKDIATPKYDQGSNDKTASWIEMDDKFLVGTGGQTTGFIEPRQINLSYLGTNNIACRYNSNNKNFFFEYLHTPERIQNDWNSGLPTTTGSTADKDLVSSEVSIVDGQGNEVYKINKRLEGWTFCPDMCPYLNNDVFQLGSGADKPKLQINSFSELIPWVIYDSHMGINLNFGKSALLPPNDDSGKNQLEVWNNSVLGIMGFSFEQFNPKEVLFSENGAQARVRYDNNNSLYNPTTNCQVVNTDANQFVVSPWGAVRYGTQLPYQIILYDIEYTRYGENAVANVSSPYMPSISQSTQSIQITGVNLPRVVLKPFYNIRTDILSQDRYVGGINSGLAFPIIASVNRINADKDFVQLDGGGEVFTITTPLKFSSITTAITDSDGKFGELDNGSVVVYKITKMDNLQNYDILAQIQQKLKK